MDKVLMKGNEAVAEAAIKAGLQFYAGYPITPQNEIPEILSKRLPEAGGVFIQAESEIAAINMIYLWSKGNDIFKFSWNKLEARGNLIYGISRTSWSNSEHDARRTRTWQHLRKSG